VFEEYVTTHKTSLAGSDGELPDRDEVLGKFYTLDLEKEGAIFTLERLKRCQQDQDEPQVDDQVVESEEQQARRTVSRDDYDEMIQVLKDSLEREVIVTATLQETSDLSSSDDDDDEDDDDDNESEDEDPSDRASIER